MKKLAILTASIIAISSGSAFAEEMGKKKHMLDLDGDGVVTKSEFLRHAEERFEKIDKDGSGDISREEGKAAHKKMREHRKERMGERREKMEERKENREEMRGEGRGDRRESPAPASVNE